MPEKNERALRLEKKWVALEVELVRAVERGHRSPSKRERKRAAWQTQKIEEACQDFGAERLIDLREGLNLALEGEEVLDSLEMILEQDHRSALARLLEAWRLLLRRNPITN